MRFFALAVVAALTLAGPARAQLAQATLEEVDTHTTGSVFPGPREGETRNVWVWRPTNAPATPLPVLYMADGLDGVYVAVAHLQLLADAGAISPFMVVSIDPRPRPEQRAAEYVRSYPGGGDTYPVHERWFLEQVIPWAERTQRASPDRSQRFIGGFSNGADWALSMANDHPDVFAGALLHSPFGGSADWVGDRAGDMRWVITGGMRETAGSTQRGGALPREIVTALERRSAQVRVCIGPWNHSGRPWRELSPGSLVWLMGLGDPAATAMPREQSFCRNPVAP
ncbi:MAG: alpha/beta hydrolase [Hyphomonadaceae bacterium]